MKRQLAEKATPEKATPENTESESGYESTGSVITVINTTRSYAEVAKRKGQGKEKSPNTPPPSPRSVVATAPPISKSKSSRHARSSTPLQTRHDAQVD